MSKSVWFAFALVATLVLATPLSGNAACPSPAMTPAVSADSLPLFLRAPVSLEKAKPGAPSAEWSCCDGAYAECEWRCTQGIKTFWCDANGCGPGCCAVQCDCWIWE
jgi:hypothetical protein